MIEIPNAVVDAVRNSGEPHARVALAALLPAAVDQERARAAVAADARVQSLFDALTDWPPPPSSGGMDAKDSIWKITVLADLGLDRSDPRIEALAGRLLSARGVDGTFLHGGFAHVRTYDSRGYVCVTHAITGALARFGYADEPAVRAAAEAMLEVERLDGGWRPNRQLAIGKPGEREPSCPFGTQNVLRALIALREAGVPGLDQATEQAASCLLEAWERRGEPFRPVGFGIGTTFMKLAYPFNGYGLLKSLDTLSAVPALRGDARLAEMLDTVLAKRDAGGMLRAETISNVWSDWDFGQKKAPSPWITMLAYRAALRLNR